MATQKSKSINTKSLPVFIHIQLRRGGGVGGGEGGGEGTNRTENAKSLTF